MTASGYSVFPIGGVGVVPGGFDRAGKVPDSGRTALVILAETLPHLKFAHREGTSSLPAIEGLLSTVPAPVRSSMPARSP